MATIPPVVRHMILCDEVTSDPVNPEKVNILGLVSSIESEEAPPFPFRHPQLCVYLQMTNGRGNGVVQVVIRSADTDQPVSGSRPHAVAFRNDPLVVHGMVFRLLGCAFPQPGLYLVEFRFDGKALAIEPLLVR